MPKCELEDRYEILGFSEPIERGTLVDIFYELQRLRGKGISQPLTVSAKRGDFIYKTGIQNLQEPIL